MIHAFDTDIAMRVGVLPAVIYQHLLFTCRQNACDGRSFHEGRYWHHSSIRALTLLYPYATRHTVRRAVEALIEAELVVQGRFNDGGLDRSMWLSVTADVSSDIIPTPPADAHLANLPNAFGKSAKWIPYNKKLNSPPSLSKERVSPPMTGEGTHATSTETHMNYTQSTTDATPHVTCGDGDINVPSPPHIATRRRLTTAERNMRAVAHNPPTIAEVRDYLASCNLPTHEAEMFHDYYTSNGWRCGRVAMVDWHASVRRWVRHDGMSRHNRTTNTSSSQPTTVPRYVEMDYIERNGDLPF